MISLLQAILCAILGLAYRAADLLMAGFNAIIAGLGALLAGILLLLPDFPEAPDQPGGVIGYANWLFPIGGLLAIVVTVGLIWMIWLVWRVALNWVKAL